MKQEQETASDEITEVATGILRMQLPIQFTGLGHVNCYAMEDERGFTLVDPGLPGEESWNGLLGRMGQAGIPVGRVHTVIVTHSHPDHFGGAARLREESGADILTHRSFKLFWQQEDDLDDTPSDALDEPEHWSRPTPWGSQFTPPSESAMTSMREEMRSARNSPRPTRRVDDSEVVTLGRREWVALHTPGHTPDHLCLFDPADGVLLSGDHVLPTITPHIGGLGASADPLAEYYASLERMSGLEGVTVALPAHGHPFVDVAGRVTEIERHHDGRLDRLRAVSKDFGRPAQVREFMEHLFSERVWGSMAESETYAHLEHLRQTGSADAEWIDGQLCFDLHAPS